MSSRLDEIRQILGGFEPRIGPYGEVDPYRKRIVWTENANF
jgi:hypothetical protein